MLAEDPLAWNLAWLSWDFEDGKRPPDAHLSVNVRRTLQTVISDGKPDLTGSLPDALKVRGLLKQPAPRAVRLILGLRRLHELPLFKAYGAAWLRTLEARSHLYREPHDKDYDFEIQVLTQAAEVIAKIR